MFLKKRGTSSKSRMLAEDVFSVGAVDWDRKLFDELISLPGGTSYNSYIIQGSEKTALIDTVDPTKSNELLKNLSDLNIKKIDYVIANHAEQDHSGSIPLILSQFPEAVLVCNKLCKTILLDELSIDETRIKTIEDNEELSLGDKTLKFIFTPWVHWPETMCTLLLEEKILFSCDFFAAHIASSSVFMRDENEVHDLAKRYYSEIMMPFANIIRKNIEKLKKYNIEMIAPSHGLVYKNPEWIIALYEKWASSQTEKLVLIAYVSMHGSTKKMVEYLASALINKGINVKEVNLTNADIGQLAMDSLDASTIIVASPTFLSGVHPVIASALFTLNKLHPKTKFIGFIGSNEWGGKAVEEFKYLTSNFKAEVLEGKVIKGYPKEQDLKVLDSFADLIVSKNDLNIEKTEKVTVENVAKKDEVQSNIKESKLDELSIVLAGEAGQGLASIQNFLLQILKKGGYYVFSTTEYMSRVRGGSNTVTLRVSSSPKRGNIERADLVIPLDKKAINYVSKRINNETIILGDKKLFENAIATDDNIDVQRIIDVPFVDLAKNVGNKIYANTVATGSILGLLNVNIHYFFEVLKDTFGKKGEDIVSKNLEAARQGYEQGLLLRKNALKEFVEARDIKRSKQAQESIFISGAQSIAYGAIASGCNFISAYPMSPSTGVLINLAKHRFDFNIVVEQAEDEIGAINMCLGASYAGARALANTSGGGFALMTEGVSLAGMIETPIVIHVAQRPGPATGLPTRTAQEDLNLVLYAGHGEFRRLIYAPSNIKSGFDLTQKAFNVSDKYQVPVFVLTDQYFMDTQYNLEHFNLDNYKIESNIIETNPDYKRYSLTESGISPRGIPGHGGGFVCVDSDEHDESGHITEDLTIRKLMVDKRLKRKTELTENCLSPIILGEKDYDYLIIGWGTTFETIKEAFNLLNRKDVSFIHLEQIYPLHPSIKDWLSKAKKTFVIEGNATGQFSDLIRRETSFCTEKILRYDGSQFTVESLLKELNERLKND